MTLKQLGMTEKRYWELQRGKAKLTQEEIDAGWHYCREWDDMLVHPSWPEAKVCICPLIKGKGNG